MSTIFNLILLVVLGAAAYFLYKRMKGGGLKSSTESAAKDPMSQEVYNAQKHPKDEEVSLTLEERVELSWQFLTNITEQILNKFTQDDRTRVHQAGEKMNRHGMRYQHDVKQEAKVTIEVVKDRTRKQNQNKGQSR